ncbi:MAG: hypothetical protein V4696_13360 [Pseudomonadota bacterium]
MAFRLPRLPRAVAIVDRIGIPVVAFQKWWQSVVEQIETALNSLIDTVALIAAAQAAADSANAAAATATAAAATAQGAADGANSVASLTNSGVTPNPLSATDAGANATITVAAHMRIYGDGATLAIAGPSSLTGLAYSTFYYVYYDDATRADTTPAYASTTSEATAAQTGDRHLVGSITTPAAAAPPNTGDEVRPPGLSSI